MSSIYSNVNINFNLQKEESIFETNEDEIFYFCYRNDNIEYLQQLFNRSIEYKYGVMSRAILCGVNDNDFTLISGDGIDSESIDGIVVKLKKNELFYLEKMNTNFSMSCVRIFVYLGNENFKYINCNYLYSDNYSQNVPSLENIEKRYKILENCKQIYELYKMRDMHFYSFSNYLISWNKRNNLFNIMI